MKTQNLFASGSARYIIYLLHQKKYCPSHSGYDKKNPNKFVIIKKWWQNQRNMIFIIAVHQLNFSQFATYRSIYVMPCAHPISPYTLNQ